MNRVDAWFERTPRRQVALWLGIVLPLSIFAFIASIANPETTKAKLAIVMAPLLFVVALVRTARAYRQMRR